MCSDVTGTQEFLESGGAVGKGEAQNVNIYSSCVTYLSNILFLVLIESRLWNIKTE